jgi:ferredoxin
MTKGKIIVLIGTVLLLGISANGAKKKNVIHVIDQSQCNQCGLCIKDCPLKAIKVVMVEGKKTHQIDPALCNQCGLCIDKCPREAIEAIEQKGGKGQDGTARKKT